MSKKIKIKKLTEVEKLKVALAKETERANVNFEVASRNELILKKIEALFPGGPRPDYMARRDNEPSLFDNVLGIIKENSRLQGETVTHVHAVKLMRDVVKWHIDPTLMVERHPRNIDETDFPSSYRR